MSVVTAVSTYEPFPQCARPKPAVTRFRPFLAPQDAPLITQVVCSECGWELSLCEYEQGGRRLAWWRHRNPPVVIG